MIRKMRLTKEGEIKFKYCFDIRNSEVLSILDVDRELELILNITVSMAVFV